MSGALILAEIQRTLSRRMVRWLTVGGLVVWLIVVIVNWVDPPTSFGRVEFVDGVPVPISTGVLMDTDRARDIVIAYAPTLLAASLLVGSSVVGAEWATRGLTNLLIWEPRRVRLLGSKLIAIAAVTAAVLTAYLLLVIAGVSVATLAVGGSILMDTGSIALTILRLVALCVVVGVLGATSAAVMRSTVASFAVAFGLLAVLQPLVLGLSQGLGRYMFTTNGFAWLVWTRTPSDIAMSSPWAAGGVLGAYALAFVGVSMLVFRRQEIG